MSADRSYALKVRQVGRLLRQLEALENREVPTVSAWWGDLGIGAPISVGATLTPSDTTVTVQGGGLGFSGSSDQFHYRFKELIGDGYASAKVTNVIDPDGTAAAGLMMRSGYAANSAFAALTRNVNGGWTFSLRNAPSGMVATATYAGPTVHYAKLVRNGALFSGYVSTSGQDGTWTLVGTGAMAAGNTLSVGMAVSALSTTGLATATFENMIVADPPPIGAGLEGVIDWAYSNAFVDMTKQAREFLTAQGFQPVGVDANGWPTADSLLIFQSGLANQAHVYNGTYKLSFQGQATIDKWVSPVSVTNVVYNHSTNTTTADINLNAPNATNWYLGIVFRNTKRTPTSAVGSGVTDIRLIRPGFDPNNYPTFHPQFTDHLQRFTTLRFMDWQETNNSTLAHWADRTTGNYARQTKHGVSYEHIVELANLMGKDIWINLPHLATNDFVHQTATFLKNNLRPDIAVYVEWSNEVWNWGFQQTGWNYNQAVAEVNAGNSPLNFDGETNFGFLAWRRVAKRTKEVSDIFRQVWGDAAMNTRVRVVLAGQSANPETFRQGLHFLKGVYGNPSNYIYALAGAPYFTIGSLDNQNNLTVDQVINALQAAMQNTPAAMQYAQGVAAAVANNLKFVAYEGGPDTFGPNNIPAKKQAQLDPRILGIITDYLTHWFQHGGDLFNWFVAGATNWDSQYGTWGLSNDMTNLNTPKTQAIDQMFANSMPSFSSGWAVPGEFSSRATVGSTNTTGNRYAGPGDVLQYMLNAPGDGLYTFRIRYATDVTGRSLRISLNGQVVQTLNLPTTATWDTFMDSVPVSLNMAGGKNVLEIKVLGGGLQLGNLKFSTGSTRTMITAGGANNNTLTATVSALDNTIPTGSVRFYDGETLVGAVNLDATGRAHFTLTNPGSGNRIYTAVYHPTGYYDASGSVGVSRPGSSFSAPIITPPAVESVVIGDGSAQRSVVRTLRVTFDRLVNLQAGAFALTLTNGVAPTISVTTTTVNNKTVATLTFSGAGVFAGSLADGLYELRVVAARVADAGNSSVTMAADRVETFHRLFGDIDGDRDVDAMDFNFFRLAYGHAGITSPFDVDGDGDVDAADFGQFFNRFGRIL
jgi:hypothetical protein